MQRATTLLVSQDSSLIDSVRGVIDSVGGLALVSAESVSVGLRHLGGQPLVLVIVHVARNVSIEVVEQSLAAVAATGCPVATLVVSDDDRPLERLQLLRRGVADWFVRPLDLNRLTFHLDMLTVRARCEIAEAAKKAEREAAAAVSKIETAGSDESFLYHLDEMGQMMDQVRMVAPQETTVLLTGETGTGKTRVARLIHDLSDRRDEPFLVVNCGSLSANLIESELFGHVRGAFTGADRDRVGKFAEVGTGTLLLDDVDTLPPESQIKLLRAVEDRMFESLGANKSYPVKARIIAASNKDLEKEALQGRFRTDLYYRLNVVPFHLPPLRSRPRMIGELTRKFLKEFALRNRRPIEGFEPEAMAAMHSYAWPGNIRELRNVVERAVALSPQPMVRVQDLPYSVLNGRRAEGMPDTAAPTMAPVPVAASPAQVVAPLARVGVPTLAESKDSAELEAITQALESSGYNRSRAAQKLGISRPTLYKKLRRYGLLNSDE